MAIAKKKTKVKQELMLNPILKEYFHTGLKHKEFTPVQECTIKKMLENYDCIVQAPTGSGKTLAYLLPTMHIVNEQRLKKPAEEGNKNNECRIMALVVAPSRELINQIYALFKPICKTLKFNLIRLFGSGGSNKKRIRIGIEHFKGDCILLATPGRIESFLAKEPTLKNHLKHLEILVVDEADRYSDQESRRSLTTLLSILPKQRRTALFSATQATAIEELLKFGLRNPLRVNATTDKVEMHEQVGHFPIRNGEGEEDTSITNGNGLTTPKELINYYACIPTEFKFLAMIKFLRSQKNAKVLVFNSNAAQSEYFSLITPPLLKGDTNRVVLSLHRKMENKRQKILDQFRSTKRAILFATDILARGIDVVDIDWVLQFDIPKLSSLFVHRSGRSGRMGRQGNSLLLLTEEESAYVDFIQKQEKVQLKESEFGGLSKEKANQIQLEIQEMAVNDRKILELGSSAFVSLIEAYNRHDCQIVCKVKDLNIAGLANAFGLLRMPRIRELNGRKDLSEFRPRMDVRTGEIKFKDPKMEAKRQMKIQGGSKQIKEENATNEMEVEEEEEEEMKQPKKNKRKLSEWEQLQREEQMIKKFKKGKLSKEQLNDGLDQF